MKIGFIGFGAAGYGLTKGLKQAGVKDVYFFDSNHRSPPYDGLIRKHAAETGAVLTESVKKLLAASEIIISCVTGSVALSVAEKCRPYLNSDHLYVDVNTASPKVMEKVAEAIESPGAVFADVAMMGAIPAYLHKVPILVSGGGARRFQQLMQPYEMDITWVGEAPGQASAIKMFRSIFMKGLVAILLETLTATHRYRVDQTVLASIAASMEKDSFLETVRLQVAKGVVNAGRMAHEMEAVIQTLTDMDAPAPMSRATRDKLQWCQDLGLREHFGGEMPDDLETVLDAIVQKIKKGP